MMITSLYISGADAALVYVLVGLVSQNKAIKVNFTRRHKL